MKGEILLSAGRFELHALSAAEALDCIREAERCLTLIEPPDQLSGLAEAAAENGALASFCLYSEGKRAFSSGYEALCGLSLSDLADVFEWYGGEEETGDALI